ncbi:MAG TPA: hypothetical protein VK843_09705 [Planctomycetota bacterium]|nr:hypothetical protein [Planctomycetota bacterium]
MQQDHDLVVRLDRLERENRNLKRWSLAALAFAGVGILGSAAAVCDVVSAERFIVRDTRGNERVRLTAYETGGVPKLSFLNEKGQCVFSLGVTDKSTGYIEVSGANGPVRSALAVQDGRAVLEPVAKTEPIGDSKAGM